MGSQTRGPNGTFTLKPDNAAEPGREQKSNDEFPLRQAGWVQLGPPSGCEADRSRVDKSRPVGKKKVLIRTKSAVIRLATPETKRTSKHRSAKRRPSGRDGVHNRLDRLAVALSEVRAGIRTSPRTSKLFASGPPKMAQKVIEEAAEAAIEAIRGDRKALISESVDLLYNLSALWTELGVSTDEIWSEMDRREAALGMAEKLPKSALEEG